MVTKDQLARIKVIVERAYADQFGKRDGDLTLDVWVDHYGYDIVEVAFVFDDMPPELGGQKMLDFRGQIDDEMIEEDLLIDTLYRFHLRAELEEAMREESL